MSRNILDRSETFVIDLLLAASLIERDDFHSEWVVEIGGGIIEGKMSVDANTAAHDVDGSSVEFGRIVGCDLVRVVASLDQVDCAERQVVKDGSAQPGSEALRRGGGQIQVFIHVEARDTRPLNARCLGE